MNKYSHHGWLRAKLFFILWIYCIPATCGVLHAEDLTGLLTGNRTEAEVAADKVITTDNSVQDDRNVRHRLQEIFAELEPLKNIEISVSNGVVTLSGEVESMAVENKALQLTRQVENVVEVKNELTVNLSLSKRMENTSQKIRAMGKKLAAILPLLGLALLVFILFWLLGKWTAGRSSLFRRISPNFFIANLLGQITHLVFIIMGAVVALMLLDATAVLGTILGAAGIFGLAVGFAMRDTVENYIASILLSLRNPFSANDLVSIDGHEGTVARITSRATILISLDGNHIRIPNAVVFKAVITNFTRNTERRFQFDVGVDTEQDLLEAQALALGTLDDVTGVLSDPKPIVVIEELGESNVLLRIYGWIDQDQHSYIKVRSEAIRKVKEAFDNAGIIMPEPIYRLRFLQAPDQASPAPAKPDHADITDIQDVSVDRTTEHIVIEDQQQNREENLLSDDAPKEI